MKHFYLFAATLAMTAAANAANGDVTGGWLSAEDFESASEAPALFNLYGSEPQGTATLETIATEDNADNKAAKFAGGDYNSGLEVKIALPEGKTLADYEALAFDIYDFGMSYKSIFVRIGDIIVKEPSGNDITNQKNKWKHFEYAISTDGRDETEILVRVGFKIKEGDGGVGFGLDNIVLKEKSGETPGPVEPVEYDATTNGTTVEGIFHAQDFQDGTKPGDVVVANVAKIAVDAANEKNLVAEAAHEWDTYMTLPVVLAEGKTLKNYQSIEFDFCRLNGDDDHKPMVLNADGEEICTEKSEGKWPNQGEINKWTHKSYAIPAETAVGNSFVLTIGLHSGAAHYAIDNIRFVEREGQEPPVVEPVEYYESRNGLYDSTKKEFMVNDFQHHGALGVELPTWNHNGNSTEGDAVTAADPTDKRNLVANFKGGNYETIHEMDVNLPRNKTISSFSSIKFRLYRNQGDDNHKTLIIYADDREIYADRKSETEYDYVQQGPTGEWTEIEKPIAPENARVAESNNFKLRIGIRTDKGDYHIDDVRLVQPTATGIEDVEADFSDAPVEYYNLQGIRVANPQSGNLYIRRQGTQISKVRI